MRAAFILAGVASCTTSAPTPTAPESKGPPSAPAIAAPTTPPIAAPIDARPVVDDALLTLGDPRMRGYSYGRMAINTDRTRIATTEGSAIRVWNVPAKTSAFAVPLGGSFPQFTGEHLGVLPTHQDAFRWWSSTGREVPAPYPACTWQLASSAPAANKPAVVACAEKSPLRVRVFGAATQTIALEGLTADETSIDAIAVSHDGAWLAASTGYRVHVFDIATGRRAWVQPFQARYCFAFDRSGHLLLGDSDSHRTKTAIILVNATDGAVIARRNFEGYIETCDASPAGDAILVVDPETHRTRVFASPTLEPREVLPAALPQRDAAFSADGRSIYALNDDHVIEWERDAKRWAPTIGHLGDTAAMALSPNGDTVATVGTDGRLILWPLDGSPSRTLRDGLDFALTAVAFSLDGTRIAIGSAAETFPDFAGTPDGKSVVEVWNVSTGKRIFRVKRSTDEIVTLGFTRNQRLFVLDGSSQLAELDAKTGALRSRRILTPHFGDIAGGIEVIDAAFNADATRLMAWLGAGKDFTYVVQTMRGKDALGSNPWMPMPRAAGFTADGHAWSCAEEDCEPTDESGNAVSVIPVVETYRPEGPTSIAPSRTQRGGIDQAHTGTRCHAFHPDGKRYVSCSPDGLVRVWDLDRLQHAP